MISGENDSDILRSGSKKMNNAMTLFFFPKNMLSVDRVKDLPFLAALLTNKPV